LGILLFFLSVLITAPTWAEEMVYSFEIVNRYPHDPLAFTQGLVYHDGFLYEGTGLYGRSSLRKVNLDDGYVVEQVDLDARFFGEGIAILNERIFQLTWRERRGFVYDLGSLENIDTFSYRGEGWGLTTDGELLIMSDGSNRLTYLDPQSFELVKQQEVLGQEGPIWNLNELEYMGGEIFANVWFDHRICRIHPETGEVLGWIDLSELYTLEKAENSQADVVNGIAYDEENDRLFVTGKLWSSIYEISIHPSRR